MGQRNTQYTIEDKILFGTSKEYNVSKNPYDNNYKEKVKINPEKNMRK